MQLPKKPEYLKNELTLAIDSYDKPKELSNASAWSQLILNLLFTNPGTYPSLPDMGIGIEMVEYNTLETTISMLNSKIINQIQTYLPQIPLENIIIDVATSGGHKVLLIQMSFNDNGEIVNTGAATDATRYVDFEITWS